MKKLWILLGLAVLLTGCGSEPTMETVMDEYVQPVMATMQQVMITLPADASMAVMESEDSGMIYLCDGYTVTMHTCEAGDLEKTLRTATGFSKEDLKPIQTEYAGIKRTECVWTAAGEGEDQVGRILVLDDGNYHYVLTCMAGASQMEDLQQTWQDLFASFRLVSPDTELNTGS